MDIAWKQLTASAAALLNGLGAHATTLSPVECRRDNFSVCLNGVTTSVTNGAGLRVTGAEYGDLARERSGTKIEEQRTVSVAPGGSGLAAGDAHAGGWGMWASYGRSNYDSDFRFNAQPLDYSADANSVLTGLDSLYADRVLVGVAFGYQDVEADTKFNGGVQESDGFTVAPYAAWLINDVLSIDVAGGYTALDYDQHRVSPTDGTTTRAGFDGDRWFVATNINVLYLTGDWVFGGKIGYLHTEEEQDGYTESGSAASAAAGTLRRVGERDIDLSQAVAGVDLGYHFGALEPYAIVTYRNDLSREDGEDAGGLPGAFTSVQPSDDDEIQLGFGLRFYTSMGVTGALEYSIVEGRDAFDNESLLLTLRGSF